ncbi:hypothetical protein XU18_3884 [Perkinsela sp. CCAP 1560/4]|nr:hypothetical protein XU18_3884 [Perkinsela sp. CCAP 1560/4]|eukprot:KNH05010.1 hypothetical protein XU18_3884 [Perkinsela sp. CCAP 1560/4]
MAQHLQLTQVDAEDSAFRIQLHAYNLLSKAGSTVPDPLQQNLENAMFSASGNVAPTSYAHALNELVDPSSFMENLHSKLLERKRPDDTSLQHLQEVMEAHDFTVKKAQAIRTRDWVQKLKTPMAIVPSQSRLGTAKLVSVFTYLADANLDNSPEDFERACRFFWSLIDEFKLSHFIVVDTFVKCVEHGIEHSFSEEFNVPEVLRMGAMINQVNKIIPNLKTLLQEVIRTRVRLYSSLPVSGSDAKLFRAAVSATFETLKEDQRNEIFDRCSYYFLPKVPFSFTSAVGLLLGMGVVSIEWYVEMLAQATFVREGQYYASIDQTGAYIPYWFYHAVMYHSYRSFLARRKKTKIILEGSDSGNLGLAEASKSEDFLLYLMFWKHSGPHDGASPSNPDEPQPPMFLIDNAFADLFSALLQVCSHFDSSFQPLSVFLEWMERALTIAKVRMSQYGTPQTNIPENASANETPQMNEQAFCLLSFGKPHSFSEFSPPQGTFSIFDYTPKIKRRRVSFIAAEFIFQRLSAADNQVNFLDVYSLLYRLEHRIVGYPPLFGALMRDERLCRNYPTVIRCIIPAIAIAFVKPDFSKLAGFLVQSNDDMEHCASAVFTFQRALVELYQPDVERAISAFDGESHIDPVLRAVDQTNRELVHYKLIRLVPATIRATRTFIHSILLASPVMVFNIFIEQSIRKPNYHLMVQQSKLLLLPGGHAPLAENESWSAFLSLNRKRLQLLAILSLHKAKSIEGGIFSFEQKENEISSVASFYCISCRSIIYHIIEKLDAQPSAASETHRWHTYACIRSVFRFVLGHILKYRAYKITVLMFLKSIAEHLLFETCPSETGVAVEVNSDESFSQVSSLFPLSIRGLSPLSMRHSINTHRKKKNPLFAQLEKSCHQRFVMSRLIQWLTSIFGGYSLFLANAGETGDSDLCMSHHMITYVLFLESLFGTHVMPDRPDDTMHSCSSKFHSLLTEVKHTLIESFQDESGTSEGLLLRRLRKLIDICVDLQTIFSDEEPVTEPILTKALDLPETFSFEPYDVCYSKQAYQDLISSLQRRQKIPTSDTRLSCIGEFFIVFQEHRVDESDLIGFMVDAIRLVELQHKEDYQSIQISTGSTLCGKSILPSISQLLTGIAKSIQGAFAAASYVTMICGFRDATNAPIARLGRGRQVSVFVDYMQHYFKQILSAIFLTLPCYTSGECTKVGIFLNTTLAFIERAMACGSEEASEIYEESTKILEEGLLSVLASVGHSKHEAADEPSTDVTNPEMEQHNKAPLYLLQNCLVVLWEVRFHLRTMKGSVGFLQNIERMTNILLFDKASCDEDNEATSTLQRLLSASIENDEIEMIKPQVIALIKWTQKAKASTLPVRSSACKRGRENDAVETAETKADEGDGIL